MPRAPAQAGLVLKEAAGGAWMINRPGFGRSPPTGRADRENPWGLWNEGRTDVNQNNRKPSAAACGYFLAFVPVASWGVPRDRGGAFLRNSYRPAFFLVSRTWRAMCSQVRSKLVRR